MAAHELTSRRFALSGVPVFMYHDVCAAPASNGRYSISPPLFREHLAFLREQGFAVVKLSELQAGPEVRRVALTFDDGLASHYEHVFPALLEARRTATFFVTTALVDSPGYLTWSQLRAMSAAGMTIGSHGREHIDYTGLPAASAEGELVSSRVELEDRLGESVTTFSAPYGFLNRRLADAARRVGFRWICSSRPWLATVNSAVISRLAIYRDTDLPRFSAMADRSAFPLLARRARSAFLYLPKQFLMHASPARLGGDVGREIG